MAGPWVTLRVDVLSRAASGFPHTMSLLLGLLILNAVLHAVLVARFGVRNGNQPFLVFAFVYAALAVAVHLAVPHVLWAVLVLSVFGFIGLTVTFKKAPRDKTLDRIIWVIDAATGTFTRGAGSGTGFRVKPATRSAIS